jgi:YggT family protein
MSLTIVTLISWIFQFFTVLIFIEVIASWVMMARVQLPAFVFDVLRIIHSITSVVLDPIRRVIPTVGGLDLSPIIALFLLDLLRRVIVTALLR